MSDTITPKRLAKQVVARNKGIYCNAVYHFGLDPMFECDYTAVVSMPFHMCSWEYVFVIFDPNDNVDFIRSTNYHKTDIVKFLEECFMDYMNQKKVKRFYYWNYVLFDEENAFILDRIGGD